jgi:hypothetical protein
MAQRRMFSKKIVSSDAFLDMSIATQALYFHLGMEADDDGFVNPKKIMKMIGSSDDDLKVLVAKRFALPFENGVVVIKHWLINNQIRKDFYEPTMYQEQKKLIETKENKAYTECKQNVNNLLTQYSIDKDRLDKISLVKEETPSQIANNFFLKGNYYKEYLELFSNDSNKEFISKEFDKFILYWTEPNATGNKQRWQKETTFEVKRRLTTWLGKVGSFNNSNKKISKIL